MQLYVLPLASEHVQQLVNTDVLADALVAHEEYGPLPRSLGTQQGSEGGVGGVGVKEHPRRRDELGTHRHTPRH